MSASKILRAQELSESNIGKGYFDRAPILLQRMNVLDIRTIRVKQIEAESRSMYRQTRYHLKIHHQCFERIKFACDLAKAVCNNCKCILPKALCLTCFANITSTSACAQCSEDMLQKLQMQDEKSVEFRGHGTRRPSLMLRIMAKVEGPYLQINCSQTKSRNIYHSIGKSKIECCGHL